MDICESWTPGLGPVLPSGAEIRPGVQLVRRTARTRYNAEDAGPVTGLLARTTATAEALRGWGRRSDGSVDGGVGTARLRLAVRVGVAVRARARARAPAPARFRGAVGVSGPVPSARRRAR